MISYIVQFQNQNEEKITDEIWLPIFFEKKTFYIVPNDIPRGCKTSESAFPVQEHPKTSENH